MINLILFLGYYFISNKYLKRAKSSENNLYRKNIINTYNCKKEKNTYYPSYHKYKRTNCKNDLIYKIKNFLVFF